MIRWFPVPLLAVLLLASPSRAEDGPGAAEKISRLLASDRYPRAMELWEENRKAIIGSLPACLATAGAFLEFSTGELARRYREIPVECVDVALFCLDAAGPVVPESDGGGRLTISRAYLDAADVCASHGRGSAAVKARKHAVGILETITTGSRVPRGAWEQLGRAHLVLAGSEPKQAEDHLTKAADAYERAAGRSADTAPLHRTLGDVRVRLARLLEKRLATDPKDRGLETALRKAWEGAVDAYRGGLKVTKDDSRLKAAYNECLWELKALTRGKYRGKPIAVPRRLRHGRLQLSMPVSGRWQILGESSLSAWDEIFDALKEDKARGRSLRILIDQYWWKRSTKPPGTEESVQGDDVNGLARRAEAVMRDYFVEVTKTVPRKGIALRGKFKEAIQFTMRGKVEGGSLMEYRSIFIKDPRVMFTYHVTVIADVTTLDRFPHELDFILSTLASVIKR